MRNSHEIFIRNPEGNRQFGLQIWKVDVNMLNKQLLTHDKGWSSSWGLDKELTIPHHKKLARYEMFTQGL